MGLRLVRQDVDPVIDQTRTFTLQLFSADLAGGKGVISDPTEARKTWLESATRRWDVGLIRILERVDVETFDQTWSTLVRTLELRGERGMLEWLRNLESREGR